MSTYLPINLPSKCLPYEGVNPEDITIRAYTAEDEIFLSEINPVNLESKYLMVLKKVLRGIDPKLLTLGDRLYIIIWEYIKSYSSIVNLPVVCSHCLEESTIPIDLMNLDKIDLPDDYQQPYSVELPDKGKEISLKLLSVEDEIAIEKYEKENRNGHIYRFARSVVSESDTLSKVADIEKLSAKDLAKIRAFQVKFYHGPNMNTTFTCPQCEEEDDVTVPFRLEFFYPDGETLTDTFGKGI